MAFIVNQSDCGPMVGGVRQVLQRRECFRAAAATLMSAVWKSPPDEGSPHRRNGHILEWCVNVSVKPLVTDLVRYPIMHCAHADQRQDSQRSRVLLLSTAVLLHSEQKKCIEMCKFVFISIYY